MATFDFHRVTAGVNSDSVIQQIVKYGPLKNLTITNATSTEFTLDPAGPTKWKYGGEGFTYNSKHDPVAGVIESISVTAPNLPALTFKITDVSIDIATLRTVSATTSPLDNLAFLQKIFDGNDTFLGSRGSDKFYGFKGKDTMNGSDGNDTLIGGAGRDTIHGDKGVDILTGDGGADKFVFDTNIKATVPNNNIDTITDFELSDRIVLENTYFADLALGDLQTAAFAFGDATIARVPQARIVYDSATGDLFYDGIKGKAPILFAHLDAGLALTAANFDII